MDNWERLSRQMEIFGKEGTERILDTRLAVVGCGGSGSNLGVQLILAGFQKYLLVDKDRLELSNLGRDMAARAGDVGTMKPYVLQRRITEINPQAEVKTVIGDVTDESCLLALEQADAVCSCVDNEIARSAIQGYCKDRGKALLDLGVACIAKGGKVKLLGARASLYVPGEHACLYCQTLDDGLSEPDLSHVSFVALNSIAAAIGLKMLMFWLTKGELEANLVYFDLLRYECVALLVEKREDCPCCGKKAGKGAE